MHYNVNTTLQVHCSLDKTYRWLHLRFICNSSMHLQYNLNTMLQVHCSLDETYLWLHLRLV